jgi:23S rRNA (cytosine1962-C5)-methyltransferase
VLSGAVEGVEGNPAAGDWVEVRSAEGELLGSGHYSPASSIRVRLLDTGKNGAGDEGLEDRVAAAVAMRGRLPDLADTDAARLVNTEGDGLPGLVVDRYGEHLVLRPSTAGMMTRVERIAEALREATGAASAYLRPDATGLRREAVALEERVLFGAVPEEPVPIREGGRSHLVDLRLGQKTGFYLDQRDARSLVERISSGRRVLDLFCYSGAFASAALAGGAAAVTAVDSSREAMALAERQIGADPRSDLVQGDAFRFLRGKEESFDLAVIDPPPLARRRAAVDRASRGYKDLLLQALRQLQPGGQILVFACSHHIDPDLFRKIAFGASLDAARAVQVLRTFEAPADHPVALDHPEGRYLTGLWLQALG